MSIADVTIAAAYNEAYNSEIYVECGLCGRSLGTGSSGPTIAVLIAAAQHDCPKAVHDEPCNICHRSTCDGDHTSW